VHGGRSPWPPPSVRRRRSKCPRSLGTQAPHAFRSRAVRPNKHCPMARMAVRAVMDSGERRRERIFVGAARAPGPIAGRARSLPVVGQGKAFAFVQLGLVESQLNRADGPPVFRFPARDRPGGNNIPSSVRPRPSSRAPGGRKIQWFDAAGRPRCRRGGGAAAVGRRPPASAARPCQ